MQINTRDYSTLQDTIQRSKEWSVPTLLVTPVVLLLLQGDKSWMRKGPGCDDDKRNISVVIFRNSQPSHGGDDKTFEDRVK